MSRREQHTLACPACGQEQTVTLWRSMNVTVSPDDKPVLFGHHFNMLHCENCDTVSDIPISFMYHDMQRKIAVYYFPADLLRDPEFYTQFAVDGSLANAPAIPEELKEEARYFNQPHIVFSLHELRLHVAFRDMLYELNGR